ncbi:NAD(P)-dependent oxidoreductase [Cupriavidus pinatubonensis]|uniref:NAD(P)-dependent oxidoreductase n=1 Tax=Cupriavidus pinatubonensis TaxID=248026 RepID=UPI001128E7B8|nr:NAD(P)-dependent oxidoreductase [Cupriavidus pinatubonensis]TPQ26631.1 oxidoreductase [Cupriavidus pinatubonensis]
MTELKVGMIGIGNIGLPMALCMLEHGVDLTVCDRNPEAVAKAQAGGASVARTPKELADRCAVILASMPSLQASQEVALGETGVIHGTAVRVYIETSTLGSVVIQKIAEGMQANGVGMIDAPVSGGPSGARAGTLAIMASGAKTDFELAKPVLDTLASNLFYLGAKPGISQVAKVINNHISAAARLATFEGLAMGVKAGLDLKVLNDVLNAGTARNHTTTHKVPAAILTGTFKLNNSLNVGLKDEALLLEEAEHYDAAMWTGPRILEFYREAAAAGYRDEDSMKAFLYIQSQSFEDSPGMAQEWADAKASE